MELCNRRGNNITIIFIQYMLFIWQLKITFNVEQITNIINLSNLGINPKIIALELNLYYDNISRNKKRAINRLRKSQNILKINIKLAIS